ncbi:MAG: acyloxyacyl hydrolase [Pyrinomonadaceae bacterium]
MKTLLLAALACAVLSQSAIAVAAQEPAGREPGFSTLDTSRSNSGDDARTGFRDPNRWKLKRGAKEWGVQAGYAPMQPTFFSGRKEYDTTGRKFAVTSIRFGRVIGTTRGVTYEYLFEGSPFAMAIRNEVRAPSTPRPADKSAPVRTVRSNTFGAVILPAGFRFVFMPERRLKPFAQTSAGFIFSQKPIPVPQSTTYNFVGDFGGGLMYSLTETSVLKLGYRYYHISNMNIGPINPGYNANMFYAEYTVFSK